ncbi:MAG: imidazolonepropionase [candidate division WOR-3 bacterium]|nr:imidazolonepropionase [candidate division WOR-3 bacterium]MCR4422953.1 imidazolonepropionase [candidate division WOR-3 bacterium]MDH7518292.1 imidazolonepropionase [bacterium]
MDAGLLIKNCGQILTLTGSELGIIYNGAVRIRGNKIVEVGKDLQSGAGEEVLDAKGCVVLPGFVDPHTHMIFGGWRADEFEMRLAGKSYKEIAQAGGGILSTVRATRQASAEELYLKALEFLKEMLSWGTTTVEVKSGYGLDTETELKILRVAQRLGKLGLAEIVPTFLGAHSVPPGVPKEDYVRLVVEEMLPAVVEAGLAQFCDVFCENFVFNAGESRQILQAGKEFGLLLTIHADEIESSGGAEVAAELGAVSASHLLNPSDAGLEAMAETGVIAVLLPGTCFFLQERHKPPVQRMRALGIDIALGSDFNPGSSTLLAQPLTLQFGCLHYGLSIAEAIRGVTVNAARALRREREIGTIEPGKRADIVITDVPDYRHLAYRFGHNPVRAVIHKGRVVYQKGEKDEQFVLLGDSGNRC